MLILFSFLTSKSILLFFSQYCPIGFPWYLLLQELLSLGLLTTSIARFSSHHSVFILHNLSSASRATGLFSLLETLSGLHFCNDFYREVGFHPHSLKASSWFPLMAPPPLLNLWLFQGLILGPFLFFYPLLCWGLPFSPMAFLLSLCWWPPTNLQLLWWDVHLHI